jgi:small subunit ribosomal protein S1
MAKDGGGKGFAEMLAEFEGGGARRDPRVGEEVMGRVVSIGEDAVFVDLGAKAEGLLEKSELIDGEGHLTVALGDSIRAHVVSARDGNIVLRTRLGRGDDAGNQLERAAESGIPVLGKVQAVNKGGVEVDVAGVRAFCPMSQLDLGFVEDPSSFVGRELEFRVARYERGHGSDANVVLSRRALLEQQRHERRAEIRARLELGALVRGTVTRIKEFGAFVDIGGIEGLLHKSELGFGRVAKVENVLSVGDAVEAQVIRIEPSDDPKRPDRISLSLKSLQKDPWEQAHLEKGTRVTGQVVRLEAFGAFVALAGGLEGLLHVSEIGDQRITHPRDVLKVGQEIEVLVLDVDTAERRVSLSLKQAARARERDEASGYKPASSASLGTFGDLLKSKTKR